MHTETCHCFYFLQTLHWRISLCVPQPFVVAHFAYKDQDGAEAPVFGYPHKRFPNLILRVFFKQKQVFESVDNWHEVVFILYPMCKGRFVQKVHFLYGAFNAVLCI